MRHLVYVTNSRIHLYEDCGQFFLHSTVHFTTLCPFCYLQTLDVFGCAQARYFSSLAAWSSRADLGLFKDFSLDSTVNFNEERFSSFKIT
mmetsp:Transcript_79146/g.128245  ORF Transcript_79146/g.128245 Transcript_79146/m.128245 type:complete len:90 (-) Transcript_79146:10-279(-)